MKNFIPIIVAVCLGLAGVLAVNKIISKKSVEPEQKIAICASSLTLQANETISEAAIYPREISVSSLPKQYIRYSDKNLIVNQKTLYPIAKDDFFLLSNVGTMSSSSNMIGEGQWGCAVRFSNNPLKNYIQPGDEIAIVGSFSYTVTLPQKDENKAPETLTKEASVVLYPRVKILKMDGDVVFLSMEPDQAIALTTLQQRVKLFPLLRKLNDKTGINRMDPGKFCVSPENLKDLVDGIKDIKIPNVPSDVVVPEGY